MLLVVDRAYCLITQERQRLSIGCTTRRSINSSIFSLYYANTEAMNLENASSYSLGFVFLQKHNSL